MQSWNQLPNIAIEVPIRSAGNIVLNKPVEFEIYRSDLMYKAIPICEATEKRLAELKEEIRFYFRQDKAVSVNGIMDGNQHIVERLGAALKEKNLTAG